MSELKPHTSSVSPEGGTGQALPDSEVGVLISRYNKSRVWLWFLLAVFVVGLVLLLFFFFWATGYRPLAANERLAGAMAVSPDGSKVALLVDTGSRRSLLLSTDSSAHFTYGPGWTAFSSGDNPSITYDQDARDLLVADSPFVRFFRLSEGKAEIRIGDSLPLTDTGKYSATAEALLKRFRSLTVGLDSGRLTDTTVFPYADGIVALGYSNQTLTYVLIRNGRFRDSATRFYLYRRQMGVWAISPIIIDRKPGWVAIILMWVAIILSGLSLSAGILLGRWAVYTRRKIKKLVDDRSAANEMVPLSEQPLTDSKKDVLGFEPLAKSIARLILNPQTEMPFTLVVSGSWGSGKSSMMNLIREAIQDRNKHGLYYTAWFNAWHMQDEQSLLDAFLLKIISCYERRVPYIFSPFRWALLAKRFFRMNWLNQLALGFTLSLVLPFVSFALVKLFVPADWVANYLPFVDVYWQAQSRILTLDWDHFGMKTLRPGQTVSAVLLGVFSLIFLSKKFGQSGLGALVKLLPKKPFNMDVESRPPGYRGEFKKEFWQIMDSATKGSRMVVFIDDIDRIRGEKVLELLEAINFISDTASVPEGVSLRSPNMIFVLGMFVQQVAGNLGDQLASHGAGDSATKADKMALGARYIEKMVQMIIPVPFETTNQSTQLYANPNPTQL